MNSAEYVSGLITDLKNQGKVMTDVAWQAALACAGWAYVFAARGDWCNPVNRRSRARDDHPTIKSACQNFNGNSKSSDYRKGCIGCKWYPNQKDTRCFDCRGFTYWILKEVYGWKLSGGGATTQWNTASNWKRKGTIDTMPANTLVCLFVQSGSKMEHTGFGFNNETVECSSGVQHFTKRNKKWTHWAIPACVVEGEGTCVPTNKPSNGKPVLKKGSRGEYVTVLQTMLLQKGYDLGSYGVDGSFGKCTENAVRQFQKLSGLTVDGIVGPATWNALEGSPSVIEKYTVTIPGLTITDAKELTSKYKNANMKKE